MTEQEFQDIIKQFIAKQGNGNAEAATALLYTDNHSLREKNRALTDELTAAKAKIPADGTIVLTAEQAKEWTAYVALGKTEEVKARLDKLPELEKFQALGKKPDELTTILKTAEETSAELTRLQRTETTRKAADAAGYKFESLHKILDKLEPNLKIEFQTEKVKGTDGKETETNVPYALVEEGGKTKQVKLADYLTANHSELMPALTAVADGRQKAAGITVPAQTRQTPGGEGNVLDKFLENRSKRAAAEPNPLNPQTK